MIARNEGLSQTIANFNHPDMDHRIMAADDFRTGLINRQWHVSPKDVRDAMTGLMKAIEHDATSEVKRAGSQALGELLICAATQNNSIILKELSDGLAGWLWDGTPIGQQPTRSTVSASVLPRGASSSALRRTPTTCNDAAVYALSSASNQLQPEVGRRGSIPCCKLVSVLLTSLLDLARSRPFDELSLELSLGRAFDLARLNAADAAGDSDLRSVFERLATSLAEDIVRNEEIDTSVVRRRRMRLLAELIVPCSWKVQSQIITEALEKNHHSLLALLAIRAPSLSKPIHLRASQLSIRVTDALCAVAMGPLTGLDDDGVQILLQAISLLMNRHRSRVVEAQANQLLDSVIMKFRTADDFMGDRTAVSSTAGRMINSTSSNGGASPTVDAPQQSFGYMNHDDEEYDIDYESDEQEGFFDEGANTAPIRIQAALLQVILPCLRATHFVRVGEILIVLQSLRGGPVSPVVANAAVGVMAECIQEATNMDLEQQARLIESLLIAAIETFNLCPSLFMFLAGRKFFEIHPDICTTLQNRFATQPAITLSSLHCWAYLNPKSDPRFVKATEKFVSTGVGPVDRHDWDVVVAAYSQSETPPIDLKPTVTASPAMTEMHLWISILETRRQVPSEMLQAIKQWAIATPSGRGINDLMLDNLVALSFLRVAMESVNSALMWKSQIPYGLVGIDIKTEMCDKFLPLLADLSILHQFVARLLLYFLRDPEAWDVLAIQHALSNIPVQFVDKLCYFIRAEVPEFFTHSNGIKCWKNISDSAHIQLANFHVCLTILSASGTAESNDLAQGISPLPPLSPLSVGSRHTSNEWMTKLGFFWALKLDKDIASYAAKFKPEPIAVKFIADFLKEDPAARVSAVTACPKIIGHLAPQLLQGLKLDKEQLAAISESLLAEGDVSALGHASFLWTDFPLNTCDEVIQMKVPIEVIKTKILVADDTESCRILRNQVLPIMDLRLMKDKIQSIVVTLDLVNWILVKSPKAIISEWPQIASEMRRMVECDAAFYETIDLGGGTKITADLGVDIRRQGLKALSKIAFALDSAEGAIAVSLEKARKDMTDLIQAALVGIQEEDEIVAQLAGELICWLIAEGEPYWDLLVEQADEIEKRLNICTKYFKQQEVKGQVASNSTERLRNIDVLRKTVEEFIAFD